MKTAVAWFAENRVAANLLMLCFLIVGVATGLTMKWEVFPETSADIITVSVSYPGASPSEVEEGTIRLLEENVAGLTGIERIDSVAREGGGTVIVEAVKGWDIKKLTDDIQSAVDRITTLPDEADQPVVSEVIRRRQVLNLAVYGDASESTIKTMAQEIRDEITSLPNITLAEISGIRQSEIHIEISENTLRSYGLTLGQVAEKIRRASLDLPAGSIKTKGGEILLRTKSRRYFAAGYRDIAIVTNPDGSSVTLGDLAQLKDGFQDVDLFARFDGKPAAMIEVHRVADQNVLDVADTVKAYVMEKEKILPHGLKLAWFRDRSEVFRSRMDLLTKNMAIGLLLVVCLLGVFLNVRLAFWVTLGIPISFAFGLMLLPKLDVSINMISMFAFIMVLGIVVDDAIVIGENIFQRFERGERRLTGAVEGALEVGRPVIFSVLTTMVAFWPLLMGRGIMGKIMQNIPIVVILVLFGSLIESLFILPAHLVHSHAAIDTRNGKASKKNMAYALKLFIAGPYTRIVQFCVNWRYVTFAGAVAILLVFLGIWQAGVIKFTFFPKIEGNLLRCYLTMPAGTPEQETEKTIAKLENAINEVVAEIDATRPPGAPSVIRHTLSFIGTHTGRGTTRQSGSHVGQIWVQLLESEKREQGTNQITKMWRKKIGSLPEAESVSFLSSLHSAGTPVEVHLSHDDNAVLLEAARALKDALALYPGVSDVEDSYVPGKQEMQIRLKPAARSLGLTTEDLARQVRNAFYGAEALRFQRNEDEVKVMVRYPEAQRRSLGWVENMRIRTPDGSHIPFYQVAQVTVKRGYSTIERARRKRVVKITADVDEKITNANEIRQNLKDSVLPVLLADFHGLQYQMEGEGKEQEDAFSDVRKGFFFALLGIYALLAIPFASFTQPIVVMIAIPFGLVGALAGHGIMGINASILSIFGMVGLTGVVVNDSLVFVHAANRIKNNGENAAKAVVMAGNLRFRAIMLTSLTTFAGLTPMLMEKSLQAKFLIPMAVSLGFGVLFSTLVTLILIPCTYVMLDDVHNLVAKYIQAWENFWKQGA